MSYEFLTVSDLPKVANGKTFSSLRNRTCGDINLNARISLLERVTNKLFFSHLLPTFNKIIHAEIFAIVVYTSDPLLRLALEETSSFRAEYSEIRVKIFLRPLVVATHGSYHLGPGVTI